MDVISGNVLNNNNNKINKLKNSNINLNERGKKMNVLVEAWGQNNEWIKSTMKNDTENENNSIVICENRNNAEMNYQDVVLWKESIRNEILTEVKSIIIENNQNISEAVDGKLRENKEEILNIMENNNNETQNKLSEMMKMSTQLFKLMGDFTQKN